MARKKSASKKAREEAAAKLRNLNEKAQDREESKASNESSVADDVQVESEDESSEEEDEYGELLTENVELLIKKVLETLKSDPKKLLDPEAKFFQEGETHSGDKTSRHKPIYLKDYHRMQLLSGDYKNLEDEGSNEYGTVDGEKPYVVAEREERNKLIDDIKNAFNGDEDDLEESDDGFLKKKEYTSISDGEKLVQLPDPSKSAEEFLTAFLDNQAWIPKKNDKVIDLDQIDNEDEQDFDDAVEDFERAYNFRYEDPNSAEIVSYARTQATLRRGKTNSRKRARDKKNALKEQEKHETEQMLQKKKTAKMNKVIDRLAKIKEAVGDEVSDETIERVFGDSLLNEDFDDADWDEKMAEIFNEQYYDAELTKPEWDDDDEIMAEYHDSKGGDDDDGTNGDDAQDAELEETEGLEEPPNKKSKKEKLKEKKLAKKEKQSLKEKAEKIVEANKLKLLDEVEEERGRNKANDPNKFRYREVSPESFGLSTREIFLADDLELNKFISIKKFAPYRSKDQAIKDKRKFTKKKHLQQWRREVFKDKEGPKRQLEEKDDEIWIPMEDDDQKRSKK